MVKGLELKGIIERIVQFGLTGLSAYLVLRWAPQQPSLLWIPIGVVVLYVALAAWLYFLVHRFDPRSVFVGKYLSVHDDGDTKALFEIKFKRFDSEYRLAGTTYKLEDNVAKAAGTWDSEHMLLHVRDKELQYIFWGRTVDGKVRGYGYANVNFTGEGMTRGYGYFVDESSAAAVPRRTSRYLKLTPDIIEAVFGQRNRVVATEQDEMDFIKKFSALNDKKREEIIAVTKTR